MRIFKGILGPLSFSLSLLVLFQSCVVYHNSAVSLEQAAKVRTKSKVVAHDGEKTKYRFITEENGEFFGVKKKSGTVQKTPIEDHPNTRVYLINKPISTGVTIGLIAIPIGTFLLVYALVTVMGGDIVPIPAPLDFQPNPQD